MHKLLVVSAINTEGTARLWSQPTCVCFLLHVLLPLIKQPRRSIITVHCKPHGGPTQAHACFVWTSTAKMICKATNSNLATYWSHLSAAASLSRRYSKNNNKWDKQKVLTKGYKWWLHRMLTHFWFITVNCERCSDSLVLSHSGFVQTVDAKKKTAI